KCQLFAPLIPPGVANIPRSEVPIVIGKRRDKKGSRPRLPLCLWRGCLKRRIHVTYRRLSNTLIAAGLGLFAAGAANAALILTLTPSGGAPVTVTDNGAGDSDPAVGSITDIGAIGGFQTNIVVGASNSPGAASAGLLQIQSLDVRN